MAADPSKMPQAALNLFINIATSTDRVASNRSPCLPVPIHPFSDQKEPYGSLRNGLCKPMRAVLIPYRGSIRQNRALTYPTLSRLPDLRDIVPNIHSAQHNSDNYLAHTALQRQLSALDASDTAISPAVDYGLLLDQAKSAVSSRLAQRNIFPMAVFRESCWDIMLLCFVGQLEDRQLCVKQLRNHLDESNTALLRRIDELEQAGLLQRQRDAIDGRRTMVRLTPEGAAAMARFFALTSA